MPKPPKQDLYTVYRELFAKENFRDVSIVAVFAKKCSRI